MNILCQVSSQSRRETGIPSNSRRNPTSNDRIPEKKIVGYKRRQNSCILLWMWCPGIIRSRCHTCNPVRQKKMSLSSKAAVCADTGATHSVAGEKLYHLLKQKGLNFEEKTMQITLADGRTQTTEILTTSVDISIQGKVIPTELLILKNARGGEPTPFIEHRINTRNHLPVAVPPYRMNPFQEGNIKNKKSIDFLSEGIMEECARFKATNQKTCRFA
ncbi:retrovirus-related Pol polyprotein from transposon 17.6 [Trichonephila clavipes]|nr:retrovirus-related Pol polyprotein from transposon 17.6 [Trichonephila clavipes]